MNTNSAGLSPKAVMQIVLWSMSVAAAGAFILSPLRILVLLAILTPIVITTEWNPALVLLGTFLIIMLMIRGLLGFILWRALLPEVRKDLW